MSKKSYGRVMVDIAGTALTDDDINIIEDKDSGEPRLSHRLDLSTGMYNGRQILKLKDKNKN